jgi:hypothetical protein
VRNLIKSDFDKKPSNKELTGIFENLKKPSNKELTGILKKGLTRLEYVCTMLQQTWRIV